jgi:hypothetical protein
VDIDPLGKRQPSLKQRRFNNVSRGRDGRGRHFKAELASVDSWLGIAANESSPMRWSAVATFSASTRDWDDVSRA